MLKCIYGDRRISFIYIMLKISWVCLLILSSCQGEKSEPSCSPYKPPTYVDQYNYLVRPGTPEWAALTSGEEMYNACQIPDSTLKSITSLGLLETCLDYPLLPNILAYTSLQDGVAAVLTRFNGFQELNKRLESSTLLLNRYQQMSASCFVGVPKSEQASYTFTFTYVEMFLAQDDYLSKLSHEQRVILMRESLIKYAQKEEQIDTYAIFGLKTSVFLMARIMQFENYEPFMLAVNADKHLSLFVNDVELQGKNQTLDLIVNYAKEFN